MCIRDRGLSVPRKVDKFIKETGLNYEFNAGIDCNYHIKEWNGVAPIVEVITFDFNYKESEN
jgi:hypothetical protein